MLTGLPEGLSYDVGTAVEELELVGPRPTRDPAVTSATFVAWNAVIYVPDLHGFDLTVGVRNLLGVREEVPAQEDYDRETELVAATEARVRDLNRAFLPRMAAWVERQTDAGALRALPLELWEPVLLGPSQELARLWLAGRLQITLADAERMLAETTWNAVKVDTA